MESAGFRLRSTCFGEWGMTENITNISLLSYGKRRISLTLNLLRRMGYDGKHNKHIITQLWKAQDFAYAQPASANGV